MREKEKNPEKQLSDQEILSLQEKDFRLWMLKMVQETGNKLEAKMDNLEETQSKEIQDIKFKQEKMQNTITEKKKKFIRSSQQQNAGGRRTNKRSEVQISGNYGCRTEKSKRLKTNEESLQELWDNVKRTNICII